eukprot:scaffold11667_cov21-Tisochrysis_lutea.AAC.1
MRAPSGVLGLRMPLAALELNNRKHDALKPAWMIICQNVKLLSAQELTFARERGVPIIDIRPPADYEQAHIPGAQNVPFYQPITG